MTNKILIDEALVRQALDALELLVYTNKHYAQGEGYIAIQALRQALADAALDKMADNAKELGLSYEQPAPEHCEAGPEYCPECKTEAEKTAYAFGWYKALESVREQKEPDPDELTIAYMSGLHEGKKIGAKEGLNKLATWMMQCGFATGHGDTMEELLDELGIEIEGKLKERNT